jgi:hypothetical protein
VWDVDRRRAVHEGEDVKTGDRVICTNWGSRPGVIVKLAKMTALVRLDRSCTDTRESIDSLRAETAADVAKRAHEVALAAWNATRPTTTIAQVEVSRSCSHPSQSASVFMARTPDDMRAAASELLLLADWFATRPADQ